MGNFLLGLISRLDRLRKESTTLTIGQQKLSKLKHEEKEK